MFEAFRNSNIKSHSYNKKAFTKNVLDCKQLTKHGFLLKAYRVCKAISCLPIKHVHPVHDNRTEDGLSFSRNGCVNNVSIRVVSK